VLWSATIEAPTAREAKALAMALMEEGGGWQPKGGSTGAAGEIEIKVKRVGSAAPAGSIGAPCLSV